MENIQSDFPQMVALFSNRKRYPKLTVWIYIIGINYWNVELKMFPLIMGRFRRKSIGPIIGSSTREMLD
ncbi:hypothetical protein AMS62_20515 [Bacillus sp. FJAT-18019]|nr:hypothetical protein AMS62_20515 [Bacillus sp. FJAT-18019]